ncbi:MAG: ISAzo13 family transposase [Methanothrix sp.]|nr:ISAzo13 family transposase [Methanothrix sp.]
MDDDAKYGPFLKAMSGADSVQARRFAAAKALEIGRGGVSKVSAITGLSRKTIDKGVQELESKDELEQPERLRKPGGGRKKAKNTDPALMSDLEDIMKESTAGDPMSLLKWTYKSTYAIAEELQLKGHDVSHDTVGRLLKESGYSLQANKKTLEGKSVPERDSQFRYINTQAAKFIDNGDPVISVDAKKKESIGDFKNSGRTWRQIGDPEQVNVYDFPSLAIGSAIPYGIYDLKRNDGLVNVGKSYNTAEFAVESIRQWWNMIGKYNYVECKNLLICADGGGSNGSRNRSWKFFLQDLADKIGVAITVCHFPPGTSKWNKIEHCMFSFISMNWRGKPLASYETIIKLIGSTKTKKGLKVEARLDERDYEKGKRISDEDMARLKIIIHELYPNWNYSIEPRVTLPESRIFG